MVCATGGGSRQVVCVVSPQERLIQSSSMGPRMRSILSFVTLFLGLATVAMWVRSYRIGDALEYQFASRNPNPATFDSWSIVSSSGGIMFDMRRWPVFRGITPLPQSAWRYHRSTP